MSGMSWQEATELAEATFLDQEARRSALAEREAALYADDPFPITPPSAAESAYVAEGAALLTAAADHLELLQGEASPTPWGWTKHRHDSAFGCNDPETGEAQSTIALIYHGPHAADAELIAMMVNLGPALVALLRSAARDAAEVGSDMHAVALARKVMGEGER